MALRDHWHEGARLRILPENSVVTVLSHDAKGEGHEWSKVRTEEGVVGWIRANMTSDDDERENGPNLLPLVDVELDEAQNLLFADEEIKGTNHVTEEVVELPRFSFEFEGDDNSSLYNSALMNQYAIKDDVQELEENEVSAQVSAATLRLPISEAIVILPEIPITTEFKICTAPQAMTLNNKHDSFLDLNPDVTPQKYHQADLLASIRILQHDGDLLKVVEFLHGFEDDVPFGTVETIFKRIPAEASFVVARLLKTSAFADLASRLLKHTELKDSYATLRTLSQLVLVFILSNLH